MSFFRSRNHRLQSAGSIFHAALPALGVAISAGMAISPAAAQTFSSQIIDAKSVIFYPGDSTSSSNAGGIAPPTFALTGGTNRILTLSSVTGSITYNGGGNFNDADGIGNTNSTSINAANSISGISFPNRAGYLVGVFLNGTPSGSAPISLAYDNTSAALASYSPLINQTFFIGDGLTGDGSGSIQQFLVPDNATTLVLGFADAPGYNGDPGSYADNSGSFTASFAITGTATAPEPGTCALMVLAGAPSMLGTIVSRHRRRSIQRAD